MKRGRMVKGSSDACLGAGVMLGLVAAATLGLTTTGATTEQPEARRTTDDPNADQIWKDLNRSTYAEWSPWPGRSPGFYAGARPHGAELKLYVNRAVHDDPKSPPHGSVIIKENYTAQRTLAAITIMKRVQDYDPGNGDWFYAKYNPDGSVATTEEGTSISGKVQSCIDCHRNAEGGDFIFENDG